MGSVRRRDVHKCQGLALVGKAHPSLAYLCRPAAAAVLETKSHAQGWTQRLLMQKGIACAGCNPRLEGMTAFCGLHANTSTGTLAKNNGASCLVASTGMEALC